MLPGIVHSMNQTSGGDCPNVLVMLPTRELAVQVYDVSREICSKLGLKMALCYGGQDKGIQLRQLRAGASLASLYIFWAQKFIIFEFKNKCSSNFVPIFQFKNRI
jgi:hypothetical protein